MSKPSFFFIPFPLFIEQKGREKSLRYLLQINSFIREVWFPFRQMLSKFCCNFRKSSSLKVESKSKKPSSDPKVIMARVYWCWELCGTTVTIYERENILMHNKCLVKTLHMGEETKFTGTWDTSTTKVTFNGIIWSPQMSIKLKAISFLIGQ